VRALASVHRARLCSEVRPRSPGTGKPAHHPLRCTAWSRGGPGRRTTPAHSAPAGARHSRRTPAGGRSSATPCTPPARLPHACLRVPAPQRIGKAVRRRAHAGAARAAARPGPRASSRRICRCFSASSFCSRFCFFSCATSFLRANARPTASSAACARARPLLAARGAHAQPQRAAAPDRVIWWT